MKYSNLMLKLGCICLVLSCLMLGMRQYVRASMYTGIHDYYPPAGHILNSDDKQINFSIVGDSGHNDVVLPIVLKKIVSDNPDFIIYIGDLVRGTAREHFVHMTDVIDDNVGDTPVYFTPGNHDVRISHAGTINKHEYTHRFGAPYYWFGYGNTLFISLDSSDSTIDEQQWQFYDWVMTNIKPKFKYTVLYTHMPPINPADMEEHRQSDQSAERMATMIKKHKPDVIFSGHVHYWYPQTFQGVPLYTTPASGQAPRGDIKEMGYVNVSIDNTGIHAEPVYINGINTDVHNDQSMDRHILEIADGQLPKIIWLSLTFAALVLILIGTFSKHKK